MFTIGISGGSASGKTHFLKSLVSRFKENELCVISQDDYYHPKEKQPLDNNGIENFDTPQSIDLESFINDLRSLQSGKEVIRQEYTFNNPGITPKTLCFRPAPMIIIEGIFVFYHPALREMLDLKIFIDASKHIKLKRRITRDEKERGYTKEDVLYRYENHVDPNYEKFVKPFRKDADIIIMNNEKFEKGLELLESFIREKLYLKNNQGF
jgi:uridine kinase